MSGSFDESGSAGDPASRRVPHDRSMEMSFVSQSTGSPNTSGDDEEKIPLDTMQEVLVLGSHEDRGPEKAAGLPAFVRTANTFQQLQHVDDSTNPAQYALEVAKAWKASFTKKRLFPPATWLRSYDRHKLIGDLIAGLTITVLLIPQSLAYTALAGMPPVYGLYASLVPLVVFTFLTTSMKAAVGPNAPISIMIAAAMETIPTSSTEEYVCLVLAMTFVGGIAQILLGVLRAGAIVNLLSWPVKTGFMAGAALLIVASQLPEILGVTMTKHDNFFIHIVRVIIALPSANWRTICFAIPSLALLIAAKKARKLPVWFPTPLLIVVVTVLISWGADAASHGVTIIGPVPAGLPAFVVPFNSFDDIVRVLPAALSVAFVAFAGSYSLETTFAEDPQEIDADQELLAFGVAATIGSFCSAFVPSAAFSRTAVNVQAGAMTAMTNTFTAIFMLVALLLVASFVEWLPTAVLAAIIVFAATQIIKLQDFRFLWRTNPLDFWQCIITMVVVLVAGLQVGLIVGIIVAVLTLVGQSVFPNIQVLGHIADRPDVFVPVDNFHKVQEVPHVKIVSIDASLNFANISSVCAKLQDLLSEARAHMSEEMSKNWLGAVVLDCSRISHMDATAYQHLKSTMAKYRGAGVRLMFAGAPKSMRVCMQRCGFGYVHQYLTVMDAVRAVGIVVASSKQ